MNRAAIPQTDPSASYVEQREEIDAAISRVMARGRYILGEETVAFEKEFAAAMGCANAIGVGNGTEALALGLRALNVKHGDAVATVSHTAVATVAAIELCGAEALLIDIDAARYTMDPLALDQALTASRRDGKRVAAIVPVHLYGQAADMASILDIAARYAVPVLEDCAQAHGATFDSRKVGSIGVLGSFSFYPTKNLGAFGDGGAVTTQSEELAAELRALREYGWRGRRYVSESIGVNSRLDELQSAMLRVKLRALDHANDRRRKIAARYDEAFAGSSVVTPAKDELCTHVYHQYVVRFDRRDAAQAALQRAGIGTAIHYPMPVHMQPAYEGRIAIGPAGLARSEHVAKHILSLPMYPQMTQVQINRVVDAVLSSSKL